MSKLSINLTWKVQKDKDFKMSKFATMSDHPKASDDKNTDKKSTSKVPDSIGE